MKLVTLTNRGIEQQCAQEVEELTGEKAECAEYLVFSSCADMKKLYELYYFSQSARRIGVVVGECTFTDADEILKQARAFNFPLTPETSFFVRVVKEDNDEFPSADVEAELGAVIIEKTKAPVNVKQPNVTVLCIIVKNRCIVALDYAGFDVSKRQYVLYHHREALKPTVAYALLRHAQAEKAKTILDPFCGTGTIPIEAAHFLSHHSINYYLKDQFAFVKKDAENKKFLEQLDKKQKDTSQKIIGYDSQLGFVSQAQKNAKIAGVQKMINFARVDMEWLETKCEKESVDCVVTHPPELTAANRKHVLKTYHEFFYQMDFVLAKNGRIVLATANPAELKQKAEENKFHCVFEHEVWQGKKPLWMVEFTRSA